MNIYSKLCKARESLNSATEFDRDEKMKMLTQLMELAFTNRNHPDELPKVFTIRNINCQSKEVFSDIFEKCFGINIKSVKFIDHSFTKGTTFEVEIF